MNDIAPFVDNPQGKSSLDTRGSRIIMEPQLHAQINKTTITNSVGQQFKKLINNGYIFTVKDLNEYVGERNIHGLIGLDLPKKEWERVFNISMRHESLDHNEYSWPLEFSLTDSVSRHEVQIGNLYIDEARRGKEEGKDMIVSLVSLAKEFGFDRIYLSGGPYLENEKDLKQNILDWYSKKFPKLGNLRERVEKDPRAAFLLITDILET